MTRSASPASSRRRFAAAGSGSAAVSSTTSERSPQMRHNEPMKLRSPTYAGAIEVAPHGVR